MSALTAIEGFDWIDHLSYAYSTTSGSPVTASASSRFGTGRYLQLTNGDGLKIATNLPGQKQSGVMGFAFLNTNVGTSSDDICMLYRDVANGTACHRLQLTSAGALNILNGGGASIASSTNTMSSNTWYYVEWLWEINDVTAEVGGIWVDGIQWVTISAGVDTKVGPATQSADYFVLMGHTNGTTRFDDVYVSTHQSGLLGDMQIVSLVATGDSPAYKTWTNNAGNQTNNYSYVDETGNPDDDATYVFTTGDQKLELYRFGNLPVTANKIFGIELITRAKKSGVGDMFIGQDFLTDTSVTEPTDSKTQLSASYTYIRTLVEENPDTSSLFSESEINNLHFGSKSYTGTVH